jgi:hypothetical protein
MEKLSYTGHFKDGQFILPENAVLPKNGEFTITFEPSEEDMKIRRERQRKVFNEAFELFKNCDESLGEEFDEIINQGMKFKTPKELDL